MYSFTSLSALSALFVLANAASSKEPTSTVSIPFPAVNPTDLGLSVVTVAPSSTVYKVGCALKANGEPKNTDCHWVDGLNPWLTLAPSSLGFNITGNGNTVTFKCKVSSTSLGECVTIDKSGSNTHSETNKVTMTYSAATITAGLQKLQAAATPASTPGSTGSSSSTGTSTSTSAIAGSAGALGTASTSTSTSTSSGGAGARETGLGLLAMAGVVGAGLVL